MQKLQQEKIAYSDKLTSRLLGGLILVLIVLSVARVVIANRLVEASERLHLLDVRIEKMGVANQALSEELYRQSSLMFLADKASESGFEAAQKLSYLDSSPKVAFGTTR